MNTSQRIAFSVKVTNDVTINIRFGVSHVTKKNWSGFVLVSKRFTVPQQIFTFKSVPERFFFALEFFINNFVKFFNSFNHSNPPSLFLIVSFLSNKDIIAY